MVTGPTNTGSGIRGPNTVSRSEHSGFLAALTVITAYGLNTAYVNAVTQQCNPHRYNQAARTDLAKFAIGKNLGDGAVAAA